MLELLSSGFRVTALFLVVTLGVVFYSSEKYSFRKNILILFLWTVLGYLLAYWEPVQSEKVVFRIAFFFSVALPFAFWLLSKALFDDDFKWSLKYWILAITVPIAHNVLYDLNEFVSAEFYIPFKIVPYLISVTFIVLVIYESLKNKDNDLVLSRLKKRNIFVIFSSFLALFSVYFFFVEDPLQLPPTFELIQNFVLSIFIFLFFYSQFDYKNLFENTDNSQGKITHNVNSEIHKRIINKLLNVFDKEQLYTKEGITITQLSSILNEKEYLVRRAINGELGYTNFNSFLNHYRITEAIRLLKENKTKELTFQEIAFNMGYQSVATFNRAFKKETGKTPSEHSEAV